MNPQPEPDGERLDHAGHLAQPQRFRLAPLFGLFALALVPVTALASLLVWSDRQADAHEAADEQVPDAPAVATPVDPALTTAVFDVRRVPVTLSGIASDNLLSAALDQLYAFVDDRSCVSVSVDRRQVSSLHGDTPVIPASTNKLLIAGVATELLGADHRFTTSVAASTPVDGVVDGDMFLIGGGDPLLVASDFEGDVAPPAAGTTAIDQLADAVVAAGVTSVRGAIVGDSTRYDDQYVLDTWGPGVAYVDAGPIGALLVNDGQTVGRRGRQRDPGDAAAREFSRLLRDRGVQVNNGSRSGPSDPAVPVIASIESAPLSDIVAEMLTVSDNDTAEMLTKEVGLVAGGAGTTIDGVGVVDATLAGWGVPMDGVTIVDGSGLSSDNRLTCDTLVGVLDHLQGTPAVDGLALAGRTGTLADQFLGSPVEGRLRAKTGTLSNPPAELDPPEVKGLAGYLGAPDGSTIEFAMVLNSPGVVTADGYLPFWGALAERLAAYPAGPPAAELGPR